MRTGKGKKVIAVLQTAVVNHEAENYSLFTDPDCHTLKDYTMRGIQAFGLAAVGVKRWPLFCHHNRPNRNPGLRFHALRREAYCGFGEIILISDRGEKAN
ncbi:hypothetical protein RAD15_09625 [Bradyrhizobium sp. 14AA]